MDKATCQTCKHYRQHYTKIGKDRYFKVRSGHCVYPRRKLRDGNTAACVHYRPKEDPEPAEN